MTWQSRLRLRLSTGRQLRELQADILTAKAGLIQRRASEHSPAYVALDEQLVDVLRERIWRKDLWLGLRSLLRWRRV